MQRLAVISAEDFVDEGHNTSVSVAASFNLLLRVAFEVIGLAEGFEASRVASK